MGETAGVVEDVGGETIDNGLWFFLELLLVCERLVDVGQTLIDKI